MESEKFYITLRGKRLDKTKKLKETFGVKKYQDVMRRLIDLFEIEK